jgi:hypothetical protein
LKLAAQDSENYVKLEEIMGFNKMKQIGATLENVAEAMKSYQPKSFEFKEDRVR